VELEQGLGPVRDLQLGPVDEALAKQGEAAFTVKCSACHKLAERYVGPELGQVLSRRRPEFVMNQILNANEMVQRHPAIKELLAQYYTPMPVQVTDQAEARAILEYLRSAQTGAPSTPGGSGQ
jgi:cytochrome c2